MYDALHSIRQKEGPMMWVCDPVLLRFYITCMYTQPSMHGSIYTKSSLKQAKNRKTTESNNLFPSKNIPQFNNLHDTLGDEKNNADRSLPYKEKQNTLDCY